MERLVIDSECGDVIDQIYDGDRIVRKKSQEYLSGKEKLNKNAAFVKLYLLSADALSRIRDMQSAEYRVCLRLLSYVRYDSGVIAYENGKTMGVESIKRVCSDMGSRTVERALLTLVSRGIFSRQTIKERLFCRESIHIYAGRGD